MSLLNEKSVTKVRDALLAAEHEDTIIELDKPAHGAAKVAASLDAEPGSIIQTLVYKVGKRFVLALIAGDHEFKGDGLPRALNLEGDVIGSSSGEIRGATGFPEGGVSPLGLPYKLPMIIDVSLKRFETLYVPAGHPQCFFTTTMAELKRLTGGIVSYNIAIPETVEAKEPAAD